MLRGLNIFSIHFSLSLISFFNHFFFSNSETLNNFLLPEGELLGLPEFPKLDIEKLPCQEKVFASFLFFFTYLAHLNVSDHQKK